MQDEQGDGTLAPSSSSRGEHLDAKPAKGATSGSWKKGQSGNPGGRTKHADAAAFKGLIDAAEIIAKDPAQTDSEKLVAVLGLLHGALALLRKHLRQKSERTRRAKAKATAKEPMRVTDEESP